MDVADAKGKVDFGIITIRQDEFDAVLARFPAHGMVTGRRPYNLRRVETAKGDSYTVAVLRCIRQGTIEAQATAHDLIEDLAPQWILVVGIAGGVPTDEFTLGDVVVSTESYDLSVEAQHEDRPPEFSIRGGPIHPSAAHLAANLPALKSELGAWFEADALWHPRPSVDLASQSLYGDDTWREQVRMSLAHHFPDGKSRTSHVVCGSIASSDRLIKSTFLPQIWLKVARQIIAFEMESAGVYQAAYGPHLPILAIRGISDIIGLKRDARWTTYACDAAAAFTHALLRARPIEPRQVATKDSPSGITHRFFRSQALRVPSYPDPQTRLLSETIETAHRRKQDLRKLGASTAEVDREILALRRQLREGGQLKQGDALGDGRYLLLDRVGRGGFGTIWQAFDRERNEHVALKVLHSELAADPARFERFFRGAHRMAELDHEAVVRVLQPYGNDGGYMYFVMEFVAGGDLRQAILDRKLASGAVLPMILQIGGALGKAHEKGIVHRDVKPANILLDESGAPKLTDFDLVGAIDTTGGTRTGAMGTAVYAAPELWTQPQHAGPAADVYGLGMTALFALRGKELSLDDAFFAPRLIDELPCAALIKGVLKRAVDRKREARYADATTFCHALQQGMADSAVSPDDLGTPSTETRRPLRRAALIVGAITALGVGGYAAWMQFIESPNSPLLKYSATGSNTAPAPSGSANVAQPSPSVAPMVQPWLPSVAPAVQSWLAQVREAQQAIASEDLKIAGQLLKEAIDKSGGHGIPRTMFEHVQVAMHPSNEKAPCHLTGLARPRTYDLSSLLSKPGPAGRPSITFGSRGPVMSWTDAHEGAEHAYTVAFDETMRNAFAPIDVTPEGTQIWRPELGHADDKLIMTYWDAKGPEAGIKVRFLEADGRIDGPPVAVTVPAKGISSYPSLTRAPDGSFYVAWSNEVEPGSEDIFLRHFSATLAPQGDAIRATDFMTLGVNKPHARFPSLGVTGTAVELTFKLERESLRLIYQIRLPLSETMKGLEPEKRGALKTDRIIPESALVNTDKAKADSPSLACGAGGCFLAWHGEGGGGAWVAFIDPARAQPNWRKQFSKIGSRPAVALSPSGQGQLVWYEPEPSPPRVGRVMVALISRDGVVGPASRIARVVLDQPAPSIVAGGKPGEWYVAWLDYEAGHLEAYGARILCK